VFRNRKDSKTKRKEKGVIQGKNPSLSWKVRSISRSFEREAKKAEMESREVNNREAGASLASAGGGHRTRNNPGLSRENVGKTDHDASGTNGIL